MGGFAFPRRSGICGMAAFPAMTGRSPTMPILSTYASGCEWLVPRVWCMSISQSSSRLDPDSPLGRRLAKPAKKAHRTIIKRSQADHKTIMDRRSELKTRLLGTHMQQRAQKRGDSGMRRRDPVRTMDAVENRRVRKGARELVQRNGFTTTGTRRTGGRIVSRRPGRIQLPGNKPLLLSGDFFVPRPEDPPPPVPEDDAAGTGRTAPIRHRRYPATDPRGGNRFNLQWLAGQS